VSGELHISASAVVNLDRLGAGGLESPRPFGHRSTYPVRVQRPEQVLKRTIALSTAWPAGFKAKLRLRT
jgi:hypothetical protein